jgi:hypothetical protein
MKTSLKILEIDEQTGFVKFGTDSEHFVKLNIFSKKQIDSLIEISNNFSLSYIYEEINKFVDDEPKEKNENNSLKILKELFKKMKLIFRNFLMMT